MSELPSLAIPGEQAIVAIGQTVQAIINLNIEVWHNASPEQRTKLADKLLESNYRALLFWDRMCDLLHVPKPV